MAEIDEPRRPIEAAEVEEPRSLGSQIRLWLGVAAAALLALFLLQNLQKVEINFLWFEWRARMVVALIAAALLGAITTMIVGFIRRRGQDARLREEIAAERARERRK